MKLSHKTLTLLYKIWQKAEQRGIEVQGFIQAGIPVVLDLGHAHNIAADCQTSNKHVTFHTHPKPKWNDSERLSDFLQAGPDQASGFDITAILMCFDGNSKSPLTELVVSEYGIVSYTICKNFARNFITMKKNKRDMIVKALSGYAQWLKLLVSAGLITLKDYDHRMMNIDFKWMDKIARKEITDNEDYFHGPNGLGNNTDSFPANKKLLTIVPSVFRNVISVSRWNYPK